MKQSETNPKLQQHPWLGFGVNLKGWLSALEIPNANLARDLKVNESTVSDWLAGRKKPSPLYLLQILDKVRSKNERVGIHRDTILDALVNLGYGWEDIRNLAKDILEKKDETIFNGWWAQNRPPTPLRVFPVQDISINYTAFEETESIARALISWRGSRERQCRALVLCGLTGMGKTETAIAVVNDARVRNVYREGVLWVKSDLVNGPDLLARLCAAVDVKPDPGEDLQDAWRNWIADPERRVLLVLDDVKTGGPIGALLQGAGPLVSLLVTTQNGKAILDACYELFPREQVIWETLKGFSPDTARTFIEKRTDRLLSDEEWETMRRIGKKSGWHPQSLHSTTSSDVTTWRGVVDAVERGGIPFPKVRADVIAQIEMLDGRLQLAIASLLKWMLFPTCFGALYAGAVLGGKPPEVAKLLLTDLEISGLIESLPAASSIGFVDQMWRITPIIQLALDNKTDFKWYKKLWLTLVVQQTSIVG